MATRPKTVIESHDGEELSPITITKNVLTDDGQNLHDILSDRKEDMITPTIENSSSIFRVGQGDNVDYSENVVDGAYESCVLKGVTKFIDNDTGEILDSFVENRDLSLIDCKSPILSNVGKNLFDSSDSTMKSSWWITVKDGVANVKKEDLSTNYSAIIPAQSNTKYKVSGNNFTRTFYAFLDKDYNVLHADEMVQRTTKSLSPQGTAYALFYLNHEDIEKVTNLQIEEGSTETPYEPYKSNILSANGDKIELTEDMFEQGTINEAHAPKDYNAIKTQSSGTYFNKRVRLKSPLPIKPNTTYIINVSNNYDVFVGFCLDGVFLDNYIGYKGNIAFTTPSNCNEIALVVKNGNDKDLLIANFSIDNIRLSEVDKTIVLRSLPNGVCDTLNVETGEYVQRIGEIDVLNTIANWIHVDNVGIQDTNTLFRIAPNPSTTGVARDNVLSNKFPTKFVMPSSNNDEEVVFGEANGGNSIYISIRKSRLQEESIEGFKQWLIENPTIIQYELKTPIVTKVDLSGYPFSYENGHVILSSGSIEQSLTPTVEYSVATNRNGQIRSNQRMVERHQKQLDRLQAMILANLVNTQYEQTLTNLKYDLKNVREEVK